MSSMLYKFVIVIAVLTKSGIAGAGGVSSRSSLSSNNLPRANPHANDCVRGRRSGVKGEYGGGGGEVVGGSVGVVVSWGGANIIFRLYVVLPLFGNTILIFTF